jgi:DNA-binding transcriptional MocR family regulator
MHVLARLTSALDDQHIATDAQRLGLELTPVSAYSVAQRQNGILLGFAGYSKERIAAACEMLARVMDRAAARSISGRVQ